MLSRAVQEPLLELWPFAVEATNFKESFQERMRPVKEQVLIGAGPAAVPH